MPQHSREDLMALWKSVVDPEYARTLLENQDSGIEIFEQAADQLATVSEAIERNRQRWYVGHFSGETFPPAMGSQLATAQLRISRAINMAVPVVLPAATQFGQVLADFSPDGAVDYETKRRYGLETPVVFLPGDTQKDVTIIAEHPGDGYNIPPVGTIRTIVEYAVGTFGDGASVVPGPTQHRIVFGPGDVIPPAAVGQYMQFFAGANAGSIWLVVGYEPPGGSAPNGAAILAAIGLVHVSGMIGSFIAGETIEQGDLGSARLLGSNGSSILYQLQVGALIVDATPVTGTISSATCTILSIDMPPIVQPENGTAAWQLISWGAFGLGFTCENVTQPSGGAMGVLDYIGSERNIGRSPGQSDEQYRAAVRKLPDTVSPNAVLRQINRVLSPFAIEACLREPGETDLFPGFFYDSTAQSGPGAYAYDMTRIEDRYKVLLSYTEMRAWMFILLPRVGLGEFGFGWDDGGTPFFDTAGPEGFYDGFPTTQAVLYRDVWDRVNQTRAAGVGFTLLPDQYGCGI